MRSSEDGTAASGVTETVLVVDDEVLVRASIAAFLRDCGFRVIEANGAEEAMQLIENDFGRGNRGGADRHPDGRRA
jgi:response regulator RpfG family c-di-GMP phosphodiesterase